MDCVPSLDNRFRRFSKLAPGADPEHVLAARTADEIAEIETRVGVVLPESYKSFLASSGGLWLFGGAVQMGAQHPFVHDLPSPVALMSIFSIRAGFTQAVDNQTAERRQLNHSGASQSISRYEMLSSAFAHKR